MPQETVCKAEQGQEDSFFQAGAESGCQARREGEGCPGCVGKEDGCEARAGQGAGQAAVSPKAPAPAPAPVVKTVQPPRPVDDLRSGMSLLSGPRNVEPYVPRKGEEYMSKEQLDHFRLILSSWKQDLMQEVDRTMLHMKDEAANFPDPNDRATQESEFSLELRTRDRERKLIRKIDEALKRIEDGSYGYCSRPASRSA